MNVHIETAHFGHRKEEKCISRAEKIYFCEFCEASTDSLGKMYGHLHFAHKDFGVLGFKEGYSIKYKNQNGDFVERAAALGGARLHTCNFCDYLTNKMSNIKQHLRGVHKQIERDPSDEGFTTVMKSDLYGHNSQ